jgi:hypothetical protein
MDKEMNRAELDRIASILASEIECGLFETYVAPALEVARKTLEKNHPPAIAAQTFTDAASVDKEIERLLTLKVARFPEAATSLLEQYRAKAKEGPFDLLKVSLDTPRRVGLIFKTAAAAEQFINAHENGSPCTSITVDLAEVEKRDAEHLAALTAAYQQHTFKSWTAASLDGLDATVMGGDEFIDVQARTAFRWYLARWERQLKLFDASDDESGDESHHSNVDGGSL